MYIKVKFFFFFFFCLGPVCLRSGFKHRSLLAYCAKGKFKVHPRTGHEGTDGEQRYSCTLSLTSALDGVGGQRYTPTDLPPGKNRYPLYRRLGGPQGRSGRVREISPPPGFDPRTVQPVASRYTDGAIPAQFEYQECCGSVLELGGSNFVTVLCMVDMSKELCTETLCFRRF